MTGLADPQPDDTNAAPQDPEAPPGPVVAVDLEQLHCIEVTVDNRSEWGCRISSPDIGNLRKSIALKLDDDVKMTKATITAVNGSEATIVFAVEEKNYEDQRSERRNTVSIPVIVSDSNDANEVEARIIDAGRNGCRLMGDNMDQLPEEVILRVEKFKQPMAGQIVWRTKDMAGVRLNWTAGA